MNQRFSYYFIAVLLIATGVACFVGVGGGLWSMLDGSGAITLVVRGLLALLLVLALSFIPALLVAHTLNKSIRQIRAAVEQLRAGRLDLEIRPSGGPVQLAELAEEVGELAVGLQERERRAQVQVQEQVRERSREALQRLGRGVAREVQKSLAGVLGYVEIAQRQPGVLGQLKNYLQLIDQEARAGREALERILRYVREDDFPTEPLEMNSLVEEVGRNCLDEADRGKINLQMNLAPDLPGVRGDGNQLRFALAALIGNAREAMLPEGGVLQLSTNTNVQGRVVVMVRDSGRGIAADDHPRVFTPFFSTKGSQKGAGLSLAISDRIVRQHQGTLDFFSEPGQGAVFFLSLPPLDKSLPDRGK